MTDPEPDTPRSPTSSVTAAATLANRTKRATAELWELIEEWETGPFHMPDPVGDQIIERVKERMADLNEAAEFYEAVRHEEMVASEPDPFGWIGGVKLVRHDRLQEGEYLTIAEEDVHRTPEDDFMKANLISSAGLGPHEGQHAPLLDLDMGCELRPSKTPGHFHLIIKRWIPDDRYWVMLDAMAYAGVLEKGFVELAKKRGATHIRAFPTATGWRNEEAQDNTKPSSFGLSQPTPSQDGTVAHGFVNMRCDRAGCYHEEKDHELIADGSRGRCLKAGCQCPNHYVLPF